jgi:hypothetical protein
MRRDNPNWVEMMLKYVAGQLLCQSVAGLIKGFRTKAFPDSGRPFGGWWKKKPEQESRVAGKLGVGRRALGVREIRIGH